MRFIILRNINLSFLHMLLICHDLYINCSFIDPLLCQIIISFQPTHILCHVQWLSVCVPCLWFHAAELIHLSDCWLLKSPVPLLLPVPYFFPQNGYIFPPKYVRCANNFGPIKCHCCVYSWVLLGSHLSSCGHGGYFAIFPRISTPRPVLMPRILHSRSKLCGRNTRPNSGHLPPSFWGWWHRLPAIAPRNKKISLDHQRIYPPPLPLLCGN